MSRLTSRGLVFKLGIVIAFVVGISLLHGPPWGSDSVQTEGQINQQSSPSEAAKNKTLGFERIFALSLQTPWRVHGLKAAANETVLEIDIPQQAPVDHAAIDRFAALGREGAVKPSHGSATAWMAHLNLLTHITQNNYSTTLIIEDDVDWSVEIKEQMATLSDKVRIFTNVSFHDSTTYGNGWDLLWVGHCGEWYNPKDPPEILSWPDATVGRRADWRGVYGPEWLMDLPEGHRTIFSSVAPICTYAYAVSSTGAAKLLDFASQGQAEAYDIKVRDACQSKTLKCISVVDQLFHHYRPSLTFGQASEIMRVNKHADGSAAALEDEPGSTAVILRSARCKALFDTTCRDTSTMDQRPYKDQ